MVEVVFAVKCAYLVFLPGYSLLHFGQFLVKLTLNHPWNITLIAILLQRLVCDLFFHRKDSFLQMVSLLLEILELLFKRLYLLNQYLIVFSKHLFRLLRLQTSLLQLFSLRRIFLQVVFPLLPHLQQLLVLKNALFSGFCQLSSHLFFPCLGGLQICLDFEE